MKTKFLSLFAVTALLLSGCSSDDDMGTGAGVDNDLELRIGSSLSATANTNTRVTNDSKWDPTDIIGIFVVQDAAPGTVLFPNAKYEFNPSPTWTVTPTFSAFKWTTGGGVGGVDLRPLYSNTTIQLISYYPFNGAWTSLTTEQALDVTTQKSQTDLDLLHAPKTTGTHNKSTAKTNIDLTFSHKLSKLIINVKHGEDVSDIEVKSATAMLEKFMTTGTFNIESGDVTTTTTSAGDFATFKSATVETGMDARFEAILLPQTTINPNQIVVFDIAGEKFPWNLSVTSGDAFTKLEGGKKYIYTITINRQELRVDGKIIDWVLGGKGEGVAE